MDAADNALWSRSHPKGSHAALPSNEFAGSPIDHGVGAELLQTDHKSDDRYRERERIAEFEPVALHIVRLPNRPRRKHANASECTNAPIGPSELRAKHSRRLRHLIHTGQAGIERSLLVRPAPARPLCMSRPHPAASLR